jgi:hypothetical protein
MFAASKSGKPAAAGAVTDPNFNSTTLLLETTGTNGQQNNTFLDSSTNNFTITRTGTPTQGTFTPFSQTGWGGFFNGSTDYLNAAANAVFAFGTAAWTVEAWVYVTTLQEILVFDTRSSASTAGIGCRIDVNGTLYYSGSANNSLTSTAITANSWNHVAWVYDGTTLTGYINGVSGGTATPSFNITQNNGVVGRAGYAASGYMAGYMSNLRVVKGTAVYTANFTPSTTPLTAISGTSLLTLQDNRFKDNSSNNFAITATGTPSIQAFSPFAPAAAYSTATVGGSGYFPGSGSYLTTTAPNLSGTWTIEGWVYWTTWSTQTTIFNCNAGGAGFIGINIWKNPSNQMVVDDGATGQSPFTTVLPALNAWNHIAIVRNGTTTSCYINGALAGSNSFTPAGTTASIQIGRYNNPSYYYFSGYISNVRIVNGTAVYTAAFTPPTAPLTAVTNTSLLLNETNAGIYDATAKNNLTTVSNAQVSTAQSQFGGSSMLFNGTSDYLTAINTPNLQLGTGDFTIEGWVYLTTGSTARGYISKGPSAATTGWELRFNAANFLRFEWTASSLVGTTTIPTNTWTFVTVVRSGTATGNVKLYVNGALYATSSVAVTTDFNQTDPLRIGIDRAGTAFFPGYTDEVRITKGIARYTAAFTAPTAPFPVS